MYIDIAHIAKMILGPDYMSRAGPVSRAGLSSRLHDNRARPHRSSPANRASPAHVIRPLDFHHLNGTGVNKGPVTMGFKDWNALDSDLKNSDTIYQFRWRILHHVIVCCKRPI